MRATLGPWRGNCRWRCRNWSARRCAGLQLLGQLDTRAALENFRGPQLHLFAEADALVPLAAAEALLEWLPDVEVSTLAASHGLPLECPDEVAGAILRFLREGDDA